MICTPLIAAGPTAIFRTEPIGGRASCSRSLDRAARELSAFVAAVSRLYGVAAADRAADHWLEAFGEVDSCPLPADENGWRSITIHAAIHLSKAPCMYRHYEIPRKEDDDRD
jgi:hypothetical protein